MEDSREMVQGLGGRHELYELSGPYRASGHPSGKQCIPSLTYVYKELL